MPADFDLSQLSSVGAEQAVLGAVLIQNDAIDKCEKLLPEMFYDSNHKLIYRAMLDMVAASQPIDVFTLAEFLKDHDLCQDMAGKVDVYLINIAQNTPSAANIASNVQTIVSRYNERQMVLIGEEIKDLAFERDGRSVADRQAEAVAKLTRIAEQAAEVKEERTYVQALKDALKRKEELLSLPDGALIGFDTGLTQLNETTNGLRRGDLTVIGGRPSMGKSVLAENIARAAAKKNLKVRFQSYEMSAADLTDRGAAAEMGIDYGRLRKAHMTTDEWTDYNDYINVSMNWVMVVDTEMVGIDLLAARCRAMKRKQGLDLLVVDHIHLMPRAGRNEVQELDDITAKLKRLAMELNIHVIAVAQLNRAVNGRESKRPSMSDIRGSGGIEQNANTIIFPYRQAYYGDGNSNEAELLIEKNRDGIRGVSLFVGWEGIHQRFTNNIGDWVPPKKEEKVNEPDRYGI